MEYQKKKPSYDENRTMLGKVLPLETPFTVVLDVSEACNFRCQYCFRSEDNKEAWGYAYDRQLMSWEIFRKGVEQIKQFPQEVKNIALSNHGEPLCNPELPEMVRYIKEQGIKSRISIHTNASLLDKEYAVRLADSQIDKIVVSLQGLSSKKYVSVCKKQINFQEFYNNLKELYLRKTNTNIFIKIVDVALEEGEKEKFYEMFEPIADRVFVEKIVPIWKELDYDRLGGREKIAYNKYGEGFAPQKCCPVIFHTMVVAPMGDVYPCTQLLWKNKLGNINESTLVKMWNSEEKKNLLRNQCEFNAPKICEDCFIRQNSIFSKEDMIDEFREEILERIV